MKKNLYKGIALLGVLTCFLSACGPEPGKEETKEETGDSLFAQEEVSSGQTGTVQDESDPETAGTGGTADPGAEAGEDLQQTDPEKGGTGAAAEETGQDSSAETAEEKYVERTPLDSQALEEIEAYLNEDSSYGFLLSSYERPEDIDLAQVFYTGAGAPQEKLEEKEEKLLLERTNQESFMTSVTKVKEEYIEELLSRKAGITYEESGHPLDSWAHIGRYAAYYHLHGDTNRVTVRCTDGWQQGDTFILHYQISAGVPLQTKEAENPAGAGAAPVEGSTAQDSAVPAEESAAGDSATQTEGSTAQDSAAPAEESAAGDSAAGAAAADSTADLPAAEASGTEVSAEGLSSAAEYAEAAPPQATAYYTPTYEVELKKVGENYRFCSNILWVQKDLIEAQSYQADLKPLGEVFFAPLFPDTDADPRADVTFALVKDKALLMTLAEMETGNIRSDRIFTGVDAVDFTDYNDDGYTDILTVCSYQLVDDNGNRAGDVREARVYTMQVMGEEEADPEGWPVLDKEMTEAVNRDVRTLNITNVTEYLTGRSDGTDKKYSSWKEAFADHLRGLNTEEYRGYSLINLTEGRTPVFVQIGATPAKGATLVVYRNGRLEETWLNRNTFQYLEYENVLYSASGIENLHYDTIYSIVLGRLQVSVQGYYGNSRFARVQHDENGKESYDFYWDGGTVSENGYRDGMAFVFDSSRAKECGTEGLLTAEEMAEKLK